MSDYISKYDPNVLYHHGILGQKWGRRQGPPYPLGSGDHSASERKAGWRKSLSAGSGQSQKTKRSAPSVSRNKRDSNNKNSNRKFQLSDKTKQNIKKGLIIGGAAAGTIAAVYLYKSIGQDYFDKTIKAGTTIQTLHKDPDRIEKGEAFYTTYLKGDKRAYNRLFAATYVEKHNQVLTKYRTTATAARDAKIASNKSATKVYDHLMQNNPEFRGLVRKSFDTSEYTDHGREVKLHNDAKKKIDSDSKQSTYVAFNRSTLLSNDDTSRQAKRIFYDEMKRRGYSGVNDINDQRYSGFRKAAKQPTIIFDRDFLQKTSMGGIAYDARKIKLRSDSTRVNKNMVNAGKVFAQTKGYAAAYLPGVAAGVGANYLMKYLNKRKTKNEETSTKKKTDKKKTGNKVDKRKKK